MERCASSFRTGEAEHGDLESNCVHVEVKIWPRVSVSDHINVLSGETGLESSYCSVRCRFYSSSY